jgi:hypothetical protein
VNTIITSLKKVWSPRVMLQCFETAAQGNRLCKHAGKHQVVVCAEKKKRCKVPARRVSVGLFAPLQLPHPSFGNGGPDRLAMTEDPANANHGRSPVDQRATIRRLSAGLWTGDDVACMIFSSTIFVVVVTPQSIARVVDSGVSRTLLIQAAILCLVKTARPRSQHVRGPKQTRRGPG